jgi:hypothetical protein
MTTSNNSSRVTNASVPAVDTASSSGSDTQQQAQQMPPSSKSTTSAMINPIGKKRTLMLSCAMCCCLLILVGCVIVFLYTSKVLDAEPSLLERAPTPPPDASPSAMPMDMPSMLPSQMPSNMPSDGPSNMPSESPSYQPSSSPSSSPSVMPTSMFVEPNPVPQNPKPGYFNYDPLDSRYGPDAWGNVDTSDNFMKEFGPNGWGPFRGIEGEDIIKNRCSSRLDSMQSPRDVSPTFPCDAHHEIRTWVRMCMEKTSQRCVWIQSL